MIWQITVFLFFYFSFIIFIFWSLLCRKLKRIVGRFICTCICVVFFLTKCVTLTAKTLMTTGRKMLLAACVRYYPLALYVFYVSILIFMYFRIFYYSFFFFIFFVYFIFIIFAQKILHVTQVSLYIQSSIVVIIR